MIEPFAPFGSEKDAVLLRLDSWEKAYNNISAGFTIRHAGNTALHTGDSLETVLSNRERVARMLGFDLDVWICGEQVHGTHVEVVQRRDAGRGSRSRTAACPNTDALITDEPDLLLVQFFADCVPLYFYDPANGAIGLAHAGWKGAVQDIAGRTIAKMTEVYGSKPSEMLAAIGPSIGGCCYEVGEEVADQVRALSIDGNVLTTESGSKARLDLKELNRQLMIKAGILPSRIELTQWCTGCRTDLFYSYRMEQGTSGRMMSWLGRKSR